MTSQASNQLNQEKIAHLAYLNWQKDGCPSGCDLNYWLEAESHLKATWHLMAGEADESKPQPNGASPARKSKPKTARKISLRSNPAPQI